MAQAVRKTVTVTTDGTGAATEYTTGPVLKGRVMLIAYTKDDFTNGVDFTITTADTGQSLWVEENVNASKTISPRQATHAIDGTASLYVALGEPVEDHILAVNERLKIVIAQGGSATSGTFVFIVE